MISMMTGQLMSKPLAHSLNKADVIEGSVIVSWLGNALTILALLAWGGAVVMSVMAVAADAFQRDLAMVTGVAALYSAPVLLLTLLWRLDWQFCGTAASGWAIAFTLVCLGLWIWANIPQILWRLLTKG